MKKTFYLVRHGQTEWNKIGRIQGLTDIPLSDFGQKQAGDIAKHLLKVGVPISYIYTSPLKRASMTADIISEKIGINVNKSPFLKEVCFGDAEGKIYSELPSHLKSLFDAIFVGGSNVGNVNMRLSNAETFDEVFSRFISFMDSVPADEDNVLLVTHGAFIKIVLLKFLSEDVRIGNCACFSFEYDTETKDIAKVTCI